jgi:hypothetical protein
LKTSGISQTKYTGTTDATKPDASTAETAGLTARAETDSRTE